jgi:hypothetical protein
MREAPLAAEDRYGGLVNDDEIGAEVEVEIELD